MRPLLFILVSLSFATAQAQQDMLTGNVASMTNYTVHSMPAGSKSGTIKSGSFFFRNDWMNSVIVLKNGRRYENIQVKLDLYNNNVHYLQNATEMIAETPIADVILMDSAKNTAYHFVQYNAGKPAGAASERWFLSLLEGDVSVYKVFDKRIEESRGYNSAIVDRSIDTKEQYYLLFKGALRPVTKIRQLPEILFGKQTEISAFIKEHSRLPFEELLIQTVAYYNSLKE